MPGLLDLEVLNNNPGFVGPRGGGEEEQTVRQQSVAASTPHRVSQRATEGQAGSQAEVAVAHSGYRAGATASSGIHRSCLLFQPSLSCCASSCS